MLFGFLPSFDKPLTAVHTELSDAKCKPSMSVMFMSIFKSSLTLPKATLERPCDSIRSALYRIVVGNRKLSSSRSQVVHPGITDVS